MHKHDNPLLLMIRDVFNNSYHQSICGKLVSNYYFTVNCKEINTTKGTVKGGFSQNGLKQHIEESFDKSFKYERGIEEKFSFNALTEEQKTAKKQEVEKVKIEKKRPFRGLSF